MHTINCFSTQSTSGNTPLECEHKPIKDACFDLDSMESESPIYSPLKKSTPSMMLLSKADINLE